MIKISSIKLKEISMAYFDRLKRIRFSATESIMQFYVDNFEEIILMQPDRFSEFNDKFKELYDRYPEHVLVFTKSMRQHYKNMSLRDGYWLSKMLNIKTCPYCNRQYTFTINKDKKIRPQFDHFLSVSEHAHLALSFYNLIPCCSSCNHVKSNSTQALLHPYFEGFLDQCAFKVNHVNFMLNNELIRLNLETIAQADESFAERCVNNIETFALKELYEQHSDYVEEIVTKAYAYNEDYYQGLVAYFSKMGKEKNEIHRLIFGNYIAQADNEQRPLSKLTADLLIQMGIAG